MIQLRRNRPAIARIRRAELTLYAGGHAAFLECPDEFCASLAGFLDRLWRMEARPPQSSRLQAARAAGT